MKKYIKVLLIISGCLVLSGGIMLSAGVALGGRPGFVITRDGVRSEDKEGDFIEKEEEDLRNITSLDLKSWSGNIEIVESDKFKVEYGYWEDYTDPLYEIIDGKLTLKLSEKRGYRQSVFTGVYFGGSWEGKNKEDYIKLYVPSNIKFEEILIDSKYNDLHMNAVDTKQLILKADYSDISLDGIKAGSMDISSGYGELQAKNCSFQMADLKMDYGNAKLSDSEIGETQIAAKYGEVYISSVKAGSLKVGADYGTVSIKDVINTNDKKELETLELSAEYGDLELNHVKAETLSLNAESGNVSSNEVTIGTGVIQGDYCDMRFRELTVQNLDVEDDYGDIRLELTGDEDDYDFLLKAGYGEISLNGSNTEGTLERQKNRKNSISVKGDSSDITIHTN
ncbi:DUF4097 family beta strand repeat-containing protein [Murimonas intestini]|uniref:DUF4097 family beta strand repeat-containing protein n=1 Tax=Murimonas intestini TaxID=1337051 RepID=UPI0011DD5192|nr:DUF4097 family beta strand repeat-containing protein [Murimonas intestini]